MTEPTRRNPTKIILIVVACVLAVCCIGGGIAAFIGFRAVSGAVGPPRQATEAFIGDLRTGDAGAAYPKLCSATRAAITQERFASMIDTRKPTGFTIVGTNISNVNGNVNATVTAKLTFADGFSEQHIFHLKQEDGVWKICGDPY